MSVKELRIGDLVAKVPVIQGGMGVGVSLSGLAGAVAAAGGIGIISTANIGFRDPNFAKDPLECNLKALKEEIRKAKEIAPNGIIGMNTMVVTRLYEKYIKTAVESGIDLIISGAGLPMDLPKFVEGSNTKIAPVVSSKKALQVIVRYWTKKYNRLPDLVVIEGPMAGGHLGFAMDEVESITKEEYDEEIKTIFAYAKELEEANNCSIPVVVAGGVFDKADMEHYMDMGAAGVQVATRFVTTKECDASDAYKQAYIDAKKEDIVITKSPVGLPGRAVRNKFIRRVEAGEKIARQCRQCMAKCNPAETPYCITQALINAVEGRLDDGLIFCGSNAYKCKRIETVPEIMAEFAQ